MLLYYAVSISIEQLGQLINLPEKLLPLVCVTHSHALLAKLNDLGCAYDIRTVFYRLFSRSKRLMLHKLESPAVIHEV